MAQPTLKIGIMYEPLIRFVLHGSFTLQATRQIMSGHHTAELRDGRFLLDDQTMAGELLFTPLQYSDASFELLEVTIGINFHWERKENQRFKGSLHFISEANKLTAINILTIEDYLISVISSEMSATSSLELLKAHAVISRSWLLAQVVKGNELKAAKTDYNPVVESATEYIRWYDREDHTNFDVCADDHCQRYQGITRQTSQLVEQAIAETSGVVLTDQGRICDARFSKCCGGVAETFENVWEPVHHRYLQAIIDNSESSTAWDYNLTAEAAADRWIRHSPEAFCNTTDKRVLSQVLNDYDQETNDFYRWVVEYPQEKIAELIARKTGRDFGTILDLIPIERGQSGRLIKLKIVGTRLTLTIGKELEIRKTLSESHLYSSAFVVDKLNIKEGVPESFRLTGAGWGHGVGLCQIGAAMMGEKGYTFNQILNHYFVGAALEKIY